MRAQARRVPEIEQADMWDYPLHNYTHYMYKIQRERADASRLSLSLTFYICNQENYYQQQLDATNLTIMSINRFQDHHWEPVHLTPHKLVRSIPKAGIKRGTKQESVAFYTNPTGKQCGHMIQNRILKEKQ